MTYATLGLRCVYGRMRHSRLVFMDDARWSLLRAENLAVPTTAFVKTINMDRDDFDILLFTLFLSTASNFVAAVAKKKKRNRRTWVREIFQSRELYGYNNTLIRELRDHDPIYYFEFMRMTPEIFDWLLERVAPVIQKQNTFWRRPISANERLALTLRFLATGETFRSLSFAFRIGRSTVSEIIPETCRAIWESLQPDFMPLPKDKKDWRKIALNFQEKWQLPHCCGSIDGKHVIRECPPNTGSLNFNYKGTFSTVLMALADANYKFIAIDYGHYGSESDGGIFRKSSLGQQVIRRTLEFPDPDYLPGSGNKFPYFFIGDEAFPLCFNLLRPYSKSELLYRARVFNYRLSRARRVVENAFGILAARFRIYRRPLNFSDKTTESVVLASCVLHNLLVEKLPAYLPADMVDTENYDHNITPGTWRNSTSDCLKNVGQFGSNMYAKQVKILRDNYANYLVTEGAVDWQDEMLNHKKNF